MTSYHSATQYQEPYRHIASITAVKGHGSSNARALQNHRSAQESVSLWC